MRKRLIPVALTAILIFTLTANAQAAENLELLISGSLLPGSGQQREVQRAGADVLVDGRSVFQEARTQVYEGTTYISLAAVTQAMYPDAQVTWTGTHARAEAAGLELTARPGECYLVANGRYLYVPDGVLLEEGVTLVPVRTLARALGATVSWDGETGNIAINADGSGPILPGDSYYDSSDLYWMSRIIHAESGNQPLDGKVAVGTVILNRVQSPSFPDTVYDVIFDGNQFTPTKNGAIHRDPNEESVIAAKLCLDGARVAGNSLYFNRAGLDCWASRHRRLSVTIGGHSFYE